MRIAFITSEYSGLPNSGGIGSYFRHAARCLANAGHDIEVFTSGEPGLLRPEKGIVFHQLGMPTPPIFAFHAAEALVDRHRQAPFDLLESAEFKTEGIHAARAVPGMAHVIRIHSPSVMLNRYLDLPPTKWHRLTRPLKQTRIALGAWRRGLPIPPIHLDTRPPLWFPNRENEEREAVASADLVIVMNEEMRRLVRDYWSIWDDVVREVPNPFYRSPDRSIPATNQKQNRVLGFAGRLEPRKGVLELAQALKQVLPRHPDWNVVLAGASVPSCLSGADVGEMAKEQLKSFGSRVQFPGALPPDEMDAFLDGLDLCVFPSLWETFHYAVLEAMMAGKAIVATRTGAVVDLLDHGAAGLLVDPGNVRQLARALDALIGDAGRRERLGKAAQQRARLKYSEAAVTPAIIEAYHFALERRNRRISK